MERQAIGSRRLISLVFLLALVVVLMQKAADPRYVSQAFKALGVPLDEVVEDEPTDEFLSLPTAQATQAGNPSLSASVTSSRWQKTCDDLMPRILQSGTQAQQIEFARAWLAVGKVQAGQQQALSQDSALLLERWRGEMQEELVRLQGLASGSDRAEASDSWAQQIHRFGQEWDALWTSIGLPVSNDVADSNDVEGQRESSAEFNRSLNLSLDAILLGMMRDGEPWRANELVAFERWMTKASEVGSYTDQGKLVRPPLISTLQLESEHEMYRGRPLRFRGSLRRSERIDRTGAIAAEGYLSMWLRGEDGSSQPVALYSLNLEAADFANLINESENEFPVLEVIGLGGKRLAYASEAGVQVAPTIFAGQIRRIEPSAAGPAVANTDSAWLPLAIGAALGLIVVLPIALSWKKNRLVRPHRGFRVGAGSNASRQESASTRSLLWCFLMCGLAVTLCSVSSRVLGQDEVPPWVAAEDPEQVRQQILNTRLGELLSNLPVTSTLEGFETANQPSDTLLQILHLVSQVGWDATREVEVRPDQRGFYATHGQVQGVARKISALELTDEQVSWYTHLDAARVYRLEVHPFDELDFVKSNNRTAEVGSGDLTNVSDQPAIVYCQNAPEAWLTAPQLVQPVTVNGLGLYEYRDGAAKETRPEIVLCEGPHWNLLAGGKLESFAIGQLQPQVTAAFLRWGLEGWDLSWADLIRSYDQRPLQASEAEALYSLMHVVGKSAAQPSNRSAQLDAEGFSAFETLREPKRALAESIDWPVRLVSGSVVPVQDVELQNILSQDYYYQWDGFVEIGNRTIQYKVGEQQVNFEREFPVTIVSCQPLDFVPEAVRNRQQLSWEVGRYAQLQGVFYRIWSYHSELLESRGENGRQAAPLVIAQHLSPRLPGAKAATVGEIGWFGLALCLAVLVILASILYFAFGLDQRRIQRVR